MKTTLISLSLAALSCLTFASCSSDEPSADCNTQNQGISDFKLRSSSELKDLAVKAYSDIFKPTSRKSVTVESIIELSSNASRSNDEVPLYVVNFADSSGYAILTSNPYVEPIMAVVEEGTYDSNKRVPAMDSFISAAQDYSNQASPLGLTPNPIIVPIDTLTQNFQYWEEEIDTIGYRNVPPRLDVWYGQEGFYAEECPGFYTGCGPTAIGMSIAYLEMPTITIAYDNSGEVLNLNWNQLKEHKYHKDNCTNGISEDNGNNCYASYETHYTIAKILRECGHLAHSNYHWNGTSTDEQGMLDALNALNINHSYITRYSTASTHLADNNILIIFGKGSNPNVIHGDHIFIVDGMYYVHYKVTTRIYENTLGIPRLISTNEEIFTTNLMHVVWGFDNYGVGYYNEGVFKTKRHYRLDEEAVENTLDAEYPDINYISIEK